MEDEAPGWDAVSAVFTGRYGKEVLHYGTLISARLGGDDPLDGISVYDGKGFYHFVTFGFSELYEKESNDPEWSGYGFELTFKLKKTDAVVRELAEQGGSRELKNIAGVLQGLARYVFKSGAVIGPGEYIYTKQTTGFDANQRSKLTGFITADDFAGTIDTPHGKVQFVLLIGMTDAELQSIYEKKRTVSSFLERLPDTVTDYGREDLL